MSIEETHRDHINVIHPDTGKRFRLNIRGDVGRLRVGRVKDCLAQSRCPVPRARMRLGLNGVSLHADEDVCADLGIRCGTTLTVEDNDDFASATRSRARDGVPSAAARTDASSSCSVSSSPVSAGRPQREAPHSSKAVTLNSLPRRQLELQTLDAQDDFLRYDRWEREAAIHDTLNQLDRTLAKTSVKKSALTLQREQAERELRLVEGRARQLETERERLARLREEEERRALAREQELAARRVELRREQEAIREAALAKLENAQRHARIVHARELYELQRRRTREEQSAMDARYRDRVLSVTKKQLTIEAQALAHEREAEELQWERRLVEEERAAYRQLNATVAKDGEDGGRRRRSGGASGGMTTPRPAQSPPTSHPYPHAYSSSARGGTAAAAAAGPSSSLSPQQEPAGMNRSHPIGDSSVQTPIVSGHSPLRYRGAGQRSGAGEPHEDDVPSVAHARGPAHRGPGEAQSLTGATSTVPRSAPGVHPHQPPPYVVERPSIRHQGDGLSVSRETPFSSQARPTNHSDAASSPSWPAPQRGVSDPHAPAGTRTALGSDVGSLSRGPGGHPAPTPQQPNHPQQATKWPHDVSFDTAHMTSHATTMTTGDALTNISGATSLGSRPIRHAASPQTAGAHTQTQASPQPLVPREDGVVESHLASQSSLVVMEDGGYYAPEENAAENLRRLGEALGFVGDDALAFDRNNTCIVNLSDAYTLLVTYDVSTERLYVYSTLLTAPSLQYDEKLRLGLYEMLLEGSLLGREVCGGGISASLKKDFILMSTSLFMPTSQPWSLRTLLPSFLQALQHWRERVAAYMTTHGHDVARMSDGGGGGAERARASQTDANRVSRPPQTTAPLPRHHSISVLRHDGMNGSVAPSTEQHAHQEGQDQQACMPVRAVPVLGVDVTDSLIVNGIPTQYRDGVLVRQVAGPAALAGLRPHDFVKTINGVAVHSTAEFGQLVRSLEPGSVADIRVVREGLPMAVPVSVGAAKRRG